MKPTVIEPQSVRLLFPTTGPALAEPPVQSIKKAAKAGQEALPEAATNRLRREEIITKCASGGSWCQYPMF